MRAQVFIDCDDLQDPHKLATTVEKDVRCMFVLGTKEVLTRPWCIAEVVIAARHHIPMVLCQVNGCTPKFEFDVPDMDDAMRQFLTSVNIAPQEVKDSFKALERAPRVQYNTYATESDRAEQLTAMLRASGHEASWLKKVNMVVHSTQGGLPGRQAGQTSQAPSRLYRRRFLKVSTKY